MFTLKSGVQRKKPSSITTRRQCLSPQKRINPRALDVRSFATPSNPRPTTEWDTVIEKMDMDRFFEII